MIFVKETELEIKGVNNRYAKMLIEKYLTDLHDVQSAEVNLKDNFVKVNYDNSTLNLNVLKGAIQEAGCEVK
jgi:copper chaperone